MKLIPLTQGKFAQVDDEDYDFLMQWKWFSYKIPSRAHEEHRAGRMSRKGECLTRKIIPMHRMIMNITDPNIEVDHKDVNPLNNQRFNLRLCTPDQNKLNKNPYKKGKSKYKGVSPSHGKWAACIQYQKEFIRIGRFPYTPEGEIAAAKAYDEAAKRLHGEFARLNFPEE